MYVTNRKLQYYKQASEKSPNQTWISKYRPNFSFNMKININLNKKAIVLQIDCFQPEPYQ